MRAWRLVTLGIFIAGALGAAVPACFKPDHPACAFTCIDPSHACPAGFTCGADNLCHDPNNPGICDIQLPVDGAAADASPDSRSQ